MKTRFTILLGLILLGSPLLQAKQLSPLMQEAIKKWEEMVIINDIFQSKVPLTKYTAEACKDTFGIGYSFYYPSDWRRRSSNDSIILHTPYKAGIEVSRIVICIDKIELSESTFNELENKGGVANCLRNYYYNKENSIHEKFDDELELTLKVPGNIIKHPSISYYFSGIGTLDSEQYYMKKMTAYCFIDNRILVITFLVAATPDNENEAKEHIREIASIVNNIISTLTIFEDTNADRG